VWFGCVCGLVVCVVWLYVVWFWFGCVCGVVVVWLCVWCGCGLVVCVVWLYVWFGCMWFSCGLVMCGVVVCGVVVCVVPPLSSAVLSAKVGFGFLQGHMFEDL